MQTLRFPGSINASIECPDNIGEARIPILMLFTLVENTFKHAMSLLRALELKISLSACQKPMIFPDADWSWRITGKAFRRKY